MIEVGQIDGKALPEGGIREGSEDLRSPDDLMMNHASNGKHGQATVLELLEFHVCNVLLALVLQPASSVDRVLKLSYLTIGGVHVLHGDLSVMVDPLEDANAHNYLKPGVNAVVALEDGEEGINRVLCCVKISRQMQTSALYQKAHRSEHRHTAMLKLRLTQPLGVERLGKSQWIELSISLE